MAQPTPANESTPLLQTPRQHHHANGDLTIGGFATPEEFAEATLESAIHFNADYNGSQFVVARADYADDSDEESTIVDRGAQNLSEDVFRSHWNVNVVLFGMFSGCFLAALDSTAVASILGIIGSEFQVANSISWLGTSYMMTQTASQPLVGKCSDIFGRRATTMFSSAVFLVGSLACGLARTYPQLLAARAFAGIGGAGLTVMMAIVTSDLVPLRARGMYQGWGNLVFNAGAALGGPLGGWLGDTIGWRWAFLVQIPICILHFTMAAWKVSDSFDPNFKPASSIMSSIKRVDFLGSIVLVLGVCSGLVGLALGGNELPWDAPLVWGSLVVGVLLLVLFGFIETFVVAEPLLAPELLFTRTPGFVSLTNFFSSMAQFAILYSVPLWFSQVKGYPNAIAGLHLIPAVVSTSISSLATGFWMGRTGRYKTMLVICAAINFCGPLCMVFWDRAATPSWFFWFSMSPGGLGFGAIITITLVALISAVPPESMASATGCSYLFRATGGVLGISLSSAILQNSLQKELVAVIHGPDAASIIKNIRLDMSYVKLLGPELRGLVVDCFAHASRRVFIATTAMGVLAFLMVLPIKHHDLPARLDRKK